MSDLLHLCPIVCFCPFFIDLSSLPVPFYDHSFFILLILFTLVFSSLIISLIPLFPTIRLSFCLFSLQKCLSPCFVMHFPFFLSLPAYTCLYYTMWTCVFCKKEVNYYKTKVTGICICIISTFNTFNAAFTLDGIL